MGQPPRLSSEAKPVPKSSREIWTPDSASCAKNLVLAAVGPGLLAHLKRQHLAGHLLLAQEPGNGGGEGGVSDATGPDVDRDRDQPSGGGPGPVLDERLPQHQAG